VNHGALQWQSGERVEGYSNFLWVGVMAVGILLHVPPGIWIKLLSLASGFGVLAAFDRWLPRTPAGTAILLALSVWDRSAGGRRPAWRRSPQGSSWRSRGARS
jgi:hypothetical protein